MHICIKYINLNVKVEKFNQTQTKTPSEHEKKDKNKDKNAKTLKEEDFLVKFCFDLQSKHYYEISYPHMLINLRGKNLAECYSRISPNFPSISEMIEFISKLTQDNNYDRFIPVELIEVLSKIKYLDFEIVPSNTKEFLITNKNLDILLEYLENDLEISQKIDLNEFQNTFDNIRLNIDFRHFKSSVGFGSGSYRINSRSV